ncbi:MAG TPA: mechanosensitive ion channel domain-containing protein [Candidatus Dormibacteraeota bacterium]|nr:mechanosensitive ion channel domain-containing protein [Candidatus Dormibacteraeota bacterium]
MIAAARSGYDLGHDLQSGGPVRDAVFVIAGVVVFIGFLFVARLAAHLVGDQLHKRQVRADMVVLGRRIATAVVILLGIFAALGFAVQSANVSLFGLLVATIVAALGVQDLLRDYVSGYYVLWERHLRVGDHIDFDGHSGMVTEVRLRVTLLKSDKGDVIIVPNSELFTKPVTIHGVTPEEEARKTGGAKPAPPT